MRPLYYSRIYIVIPYVLNYSETLDTRGPRFLHSALRIIKTLGMFHSFAYNKIGIWYLLKTQMRFNIFHNVAYHM